jgi:hypothetical protein
MALPVLAPILEGLAVDAVVRIGKSLLSRMPWAKDENRVGQVEARIRRLAAEATESTRHMSEDAIDSQIDRLFFQFQKDLGGFGLPDGQASEITETLRKELEVTVIAPARERRAAQTWMQEIEARVNAAESMIEAQQTLANRLQEVERRLGMIAKGTLVVFISAAVGLVIFLSQTIRR